MGFKGKHFTEEHKRRISEALKGRKPSENCINKLKVIMLGNKRCLGRVHSDETKKKISEAQKGIKGNNWCGGLSSKNEIMRKSSKYKIWRLGVFERDKFTCKACYKSGCYLEAHHIKSFAKFPELRFDINNGITLCEECHIKKHKKIDDCRG